MADKHSHSRGTALKLRLDRKLILAAALIVLGLIVLISIASASRRRKAASPAPSASPAPTAQAAPASEAPSPAPTPEAAPEEPDAASRVPAATASQMYVHNAERRDGFPMLSWDVSKFAKDARGRMTYSGGVKTLTGIDVSEFQNEIDWKKVAADGIDFAIIRVARRGSTAGGLKMDEYFETNINGALKAGLDVGVYFYSQAISVEEAREEARFLLEHIKGYNITYPVVFDWEIVGGSADRTYTVTRQTLCDCTRAFCEEVKAAGYQPMIYFTRYLGYRKYILRNLTDYGFWYAEYENTPRFAFDFDMWQYSDTGKVDGIDGEVDLDILFVRE